MAFRQAQGLRKATLDLDGAILSPFIRDNPDLFDRPRQAALKYLAASKTEWTRQTRLKVLKVFFGYLLDEEILTQDPLRGIRGTVPPKVCDLPSLEEVKDFLEKLDTRKFAQKRLKTMLLLSLDSGLRRGELCTLLLRDLDLVGLSLTIRASASKNKRSREVPISSATARLLGHSNIRVTIDFYEHLTFEDLRKRHTSASITGLVCPQEKRVRSIAGKPPKKAPSRPS